MSERERYTVSKLEDGEVSGDVEFIATIFEEGTTISVDGPVRFVLDQIQIHPASEFKGEMSATGVWFEYERENEFETTLAGGFTMPHEEEDGLREWLEGHDANVVIQDAERIGKMFEETALEE